jgi:hypothetical protein
VYCPPNVEEKKKRAPIHVTQADVERAYQEVKKLQRLIECGKSMSRILTNTS